jgi:hypothetical protein
MRHSGTTSLTESLSLPPNPPKEVVAAAKRFDRAVAELRTARQAVVSAEAEAKLTPDADSITERIMADKPLDPPPSQPDIGRLRARVEAAEVAVDRVGNLLALAIDSTATEWSETLTVEAVEARRRFKEAITVAASAFDGIYGAEVAGSWLARFTTGRHRIQFVPGRPTDPLTVRVPGSMDDIEVTTLVGAIVAVAEELNTRPTPAYNYQAGIHLHHRNICEVCNSDTAIEVTGPINALRSRCGSCSRVAASPALVKRNMAAGRPVS